MAATGWRPLAKLSFQSIGTFGEIVTITPSLDSIIGGSERNDQLAKLGHARVSLSKLIDAATFLPDFEKCLEAAAALEQHQVEHEGLLLTDLLSAGRDAIREHALSACPVCEQSIDASAVLTRLQQRIDADRQFTTARSTANGRRATLRKTISRALDSLVNFLEIWNSSVSTNAPERIVELKQLSERAVEILGAEPKAKELRELQSAFAHLAGPNDIERQTIDARLAAAGDNERRRLAGNVEALIRYVQSDWPKRVVHLQMAERLKKAKKEAERIRDHASEARKDAVQQILDEVSATANKFYSHIHLSEPPSDSRA